MHCSRRLIVQTLVFSRSYLNRQVSPPETLVVKGGTTLARNGRWILPENARLPRNIQGSFTCRKSTTWDRRLYLPFEGRRVEDLFALKNPTASAGFETANLGTKGQHSRTLNTPHVLTPQFRLVTLSDHLLFISRKWGKARTLWKLFVPSSRLQSHSTRPWNRMATNVYCFKCSDKLNVENSYSYVETVYGVVYIRPMDYHFTLHILSENRIPEM